MGILDKATGGLAGRLKGTGEETVRVVDYDKMPEKEKVEKRRPEKAPKEKPEKAPRKKLSDLLPAKGSKSISEDENIDDLPEFSDAPAPQEPQFGIEDESEELPLAYKVATDTAFDIEEDPFFLEGPDPLKTPGPGFEDLPEPSSERRQNTPELKYDEEKIKDVLEVLKIPATFVIDSEVLMPEDFKDVEFDLQVPQGYDIGQVEFFVERAESTVKEYLHLLEQRNEHVAKLATTVDRLQVDLENLKFDSQIAAGIGIMPTSDNDELERDNLELRLQVKRLEDQLKAKTTIPDLSSKERQLYENLRNEFSILEREKQHLEQENSDLRVEIARLEEEAEDPTWMAGSQTRDSAMPMLGTDEDMKSEMPSGIEYMDELPPVDTSAPLPSGLPSFSIEPEEGQEELELPSFDMELPSVDVNPSRPSSSSFDFEEEDYSAKPIVSSGHGEDDDDDEDDELAKLMKGWS